MMDAPRTSKAMPIKSAREMRDWLSGYYASAEDPVLLLLVGIKDLKQINDRLGRDAGDFAIRLVGQRIGQFAADGGLAVRMIARLPGREYLVVAQGAIARRKVEQAAKSLIEALSGNMAAAREPMHISARIGIAQSEPGEGGDALLARAGDALAQAYGRKGKRFVIAEYRAAAAARNPQAIDAGLRTAIASGDIAIVFQPQFEVVSGRLTGAEALARLNHPTLGEIGAAELFASADRCDLREELSHHIQRAAIGIAAQWPAALDQLRLAVNLGAEELGDAYAAHLLDLLHAVGFPPERLTLELTEEGLVRNIGLAAAQLSILRERRIRIALDDFGTGYSSLAYLKTLPLDYLKIDKSMTPDIGGSGKDRIVLRAIIAMGKALGLEIIAEGVERAEELAMLRAEECDYFQGFLRSPPLAPPDFVNLALRSD